MTEREKLIEILNDCCCGEDGEIFFMSHESEILADYLINNGIIVPPCKMGDKVWFIAKKADSTTFKIFKGYVGCMDMRNGWKHVVIHWEDESAQESHNHIVTFEEFGKMVFFTRKEAKEALKTIIATAT